MQGSLSVEDENEGRTVLLKLTIGNLPYALLLISLFFAALMDIVKIGGAVIDQEEDLSSCLHQFAAISGPKMLVHGGGRAATKMAESLGIESKMMEGRRITNKEMLGVVVMIYGGLVNKNIVAQLQALGCDCLGLTGADLNIIRSTKRDPHPIDFGYVGDIAEINTESLQAVMNLGAAPIVCPLTHDGNGQMLNTNADTIASSLAVAFSSMTEVKLRLCFEKPGVLEDPTRDDSVIDSLNEEEFVELLAQKKVHSGMIPKLTNAFSARREGVQHISIGSYRDLAKTGTKILL
ncbi:MAG: acetylglutamate kinase [Saprospiraceae bacterium]|nr:acetylglutamate kinase [Saprospiraceae bacterium]